MNNSVKPITPIDENDIMLSLPIKRQDLGDFISNLLGQPQSIEQILDIKFDVDHEWLIILHELINQRITQQSTSKLINFTAFIYFEDGMKRTINSYPAFKTYQETKKKKQTGIKIIWDYLVQFPNKTHPEKQQINFTALINKSQKIVKKQFDFERILNSSFFSDDEKSTINYQINHTERTWGDDIQVIISNQMTEITRNSEIKDLLFNLFRAALCLSMVVATFILSVYSDIKNSSNKLIQIADIYDKIGALKNPTLAQINQKLDLISELTKTIGLRDVNTGSTLLTLFVGMTLSMLVLLITKKQTSSFISLSTESKKYRDKKLKREKYSIIALIASIALSITTGVFSSYIYTWMHG